MANTKPNRAITANNCTRGCLTRNPAHTAKANTATAYKLARHIYWGIKYGQTYVDEGARYYDERYRKHILTHLARRANQMGCTLIDTETGAILRQNHENLMRILPENA